MTPSQKGLLHSTIAVAVIAALVFWARSGKEKEDAPPEDNRPPTPVPAETSATIRGIVSFKGSPPAPAPLNPSGDCPHLKGKDAGDIRVADGKVQNAVVWVSGGLENFVPAPKREPPLTVDQKECMYDPRVSAAQVRQKVTFHNGEGRVHNVHVRGPEEFAKTLTLQGDAFDKHFSGAGLYTMTCDLHSHMKAYLHVFPHGYFALTGKDGAFALPPINPGKYTVTAWHEVFGEKKQDMEVKAKEEKAIEFVYP